MSKPSFVRSWRKWLPFVAILAMTPVLLWLEYGKALTDDEVLLPLMRMSLSRFAAAGVFLVILLTQGYRVLNPLRAPFGRALLYTLPAFAVVINNLPILSLIWGDAYIVHGAPVYWIWFALQSLAIGLFEEITFRGVILLSFAESRRNNHKGLLWSILLSSAVFGAMHAVNLLTGASPVAVLMQVGYSFLIGAMCAVVLFKTANLFLCILLHAVYDFCGMLLPTLGGGHWWDTPTVIFTAVLAVAVTVYMILLFARMDLHETDRIYEKEN